ncbi:MAG: hypothetical protein IPP94_12755 [Ignavibacteria bacterium]|nr:hypothetical protein [Ignavibacteria bacterium]
MGTQQMLYIVLGVIIVGIAIVVGTLPSFIKGMESGNKDAITQDCLKLAAAAQGLLSPSHGLQGRRQQFSEYRHCGLRDESERQRRRGERQRHV